MSMNETKQAVSRLLDCDEDCVADKVSPRHSQACHRRFAQRISHEGANGLASPIAMEERAPIVRRGDVLLTLGHEIAIAGRDLKRLTDWHQKANATLLRHGLVLREVGDELVLRHLADVTAPLSEPINPGALKLVPTKAAP